MENRPVRILIAEFLPLGNKGEEAIARGIEDMLGGGAPVELGILALQDDVTQTGNITVFPLRWLYLLINTRLSGRIRSAVWLAKALALRAGITGRQGNLVRGCRKMRALHAFFEGSDLILLGHDGVFSTESFGIIRVAKRNGKRVGILGCGLSRSKKWLAVTAPLFKRGMRDADFCFFRERGSYEWVREVVPDNPNVKLAPDPAFAMTPEPAERVKEKLRSYPWFRQSREEGRALVAVTVCQKSVVFDASFLSTQASCKPSVHAEFLAGVLDALHRLRKIQYVFLPHSLEEGVGNDIAVAKQVLARMTEARSQAVIMDENLNARELKGLIGQADMLIGERTHSLIGAVSVGTPFVGLSNLADMRTHDIIGDMCQCEEFIVNMECPDVAAVTETVLSVFDRRREIASHLFRIAAGLRQQLAAAALEVWGRERAE